MLRLFQRRPDAQAMVQRLERYEIGVALRGAFYTFLTHAHNRELYHTNPRYLAEQLGLAERQTLQLLVAALYEGIVVLHWGVQCPMCNATDHRASAMAELHHDVVCGNCQANFSPRLDDDIHVTFSVHQRLRALPATANDATFRNAIDDRVGPVNGHALLLLPDFQRLFPQQRLLPDESLDVARATLLFTDLAGSTAMYARRGDPRAYHLVRLHFDELFRIADNCDGTIVKTIGDAILAVFQTPADAVAAAFAMQQEIVALNQRAQLAGDERLILKVGIHSGPCLSVTLNDRPDYFGTAVNIAARVQGLSHGGDVVLTEAVREDEATQTCIDGKQLESEYVLLRGIDEHVLVHRIVLD